MWFYVEEEEAAHYSSLTKLQEDVYTEAIRTKSAGFQFPEI